MGAQVRTELGQGRDGFVLSRAQDVADGARAMLLLADGLFRLDVQPREDTLRLIVRNLSGAHLRYRDEGTPVPLHVGPGGAGELEAIRPAQLRMAFVIETEVAPVEASVMVSARSDPRTGTTALVGQGIVRIG